MIVRMTMPMTASRWRMKRRSAARRGEYVLDGHDLGSATASAARGQGAPSGRLGRM